MYLKRFADKDGYCYTLNINGEIHKQPIKEICKKKNLYEVTDADGNIVNKNIVENSLSRMESVLSPFLDKLIESRRSGSVLSYIKLGENRKILLYFVSSMMLRNQFIIGLTKIIGKDIGIEWNDIQARNNGILHGVYLSMPMMEKWDKEYNLIIHINGTKIPFVTSDFPFMIFPLEKSKGKFIVFPISPDLLIILEPRCICGFLKDREIITTEEYVKYINNYLPISSSKLVISSNEQELLRIKESMNNEYYPF